MKSILLSLIFIISTSCTEGQKDVTVYGAKTPLPPTHSLSGYTYLPSPAPPDEVFAPLGYPFSRNTDPFELTIAISNPNSDPYTHKWCVNGEALADCINTDQDNTPLEFTVDPSILLNILMGAFKLLHLQFIMPRVLRLVRFLGGLKFGPRPIHTILICLHLLHLRYFLVRLSHRPLQVQR